MMRETVRHLQRAAATLLMLPLLLWLSPVVSAQVSGISIPPSKQYTIKPGGEISDTLRITNLNKTSSSQIKIKIVDFKPQGETGVPLLDMSDDAPQTTWSLKPFTAITSTVVLGAGQSKEIPIKIKIPKNIGGGSYYSAIEYSSAPANGDRKNVSVAAAGATLVFVTVPGPAHELMTLSQLGGFELGSDGVHGSFKKFFFATKPKTISFVMANVGNLTESPRGSMTISNIFGHVVKTVKDINPNKSLALIGQSRRFDTCINPGIQKIKAIGTTVEERVCKTPALFPGRYTVKLDVFYGQANAESHEIVATNTFWYLPMWFVVTISLLLALLLAGMWYIAKKTEFVSWAGNKMKTLVRRGN